MPAGDFSEVSSTELLAERDELVLTTSINNSQSTYVWRSGDGASRSVGYYDGPHRGIWPPNGAARFDTDLLPSTFDPPFDRYIIGRSSRLNHDVADGETSWIDDGNQTTRLGYFDDAHTHPVTGYQSTNITKAINTGYVVGVSDAFSGGARGQTMWRYDLATGQTTRLGLHDATHTDPATGVQESKLPEYDAHYVNSSGHVAGVSTSYSPGGLQGRSAWVANEVGTSRIGLSDADSTPPDQRWLSMPIEINEPGQVLGVAQRPGWGTATIPNRAEAAWFYDGDETHRIGLFDAAHTSSTTGYQSITVGRLNDAGYAFGTSSRFNEDGSDAGISAWIFDGEQTTRVGLTDAAHTIAATGRQSSGVSFVNASGQAVGSSAAYGLPSSAARSNATTWFYDPQSGYQSLIFDTSEANDRFRTFPLALSDDGVVVGNYVSFKVESVIGTLRPFRWSERDGLIDIADLIEEQYPDLELRAATLVDPETALKGQFLISAQFVERTAPFLSGDALFLVKLVPEPSTIILTLVAVAGAVAWRRTIS
jgi:hypothetical protein